jgi:hypothetical protein
MAFAITAVVTVAMAAATISMGLFLLRRIASSFRTG